MNKRIKYKKTSKTTLKKACDGLWSLIIQERDNHKCCICGKTEYLNSHHLISRKILKYRYRKSNGICLCAGCHTFNEFSPHLFFWNFISWFKENRPNQYKIHVEQRQNITYEKINYEEIYLQLEEDYKELTGEYYKFSRMQQYIMFKNASNINSMVTNDKKSAEEVAEEYNVSKNAMKKFIKDNKIS